jgi:hypothetical protein
MAEGPILGTEARFGQGQRVNATNEQLHAIQARARPRRHLNVVPLPRLRQVALPVPDLETQDAVVRALQQQVRAVFTDLHRRVAEASQLPPDWEARLLEAERPGREAAEALGQVLADLRHRVETRVASLSGTHSDLKPSNVLVFGQEPVATRFARLLATWRARTSHHSVQWKRVQHPSYQRIIGIGPAAVPFILRELRHDGIDWFPALEAITDTNPVSEPTTANEAVERWLSWGRERKLIA